MCVHSFFTGANSGNSPGFGLALVAETTSGCLLSAEACAASRGSRGRPGAAAADASFDTDADESSEDALLSTAPSTSGGSQGLPEALVVPEDVGRAASEVGVLCTEQCLCALVCMWERLLVVGRWVPVVPSIVCVYFVLVAPSLDLGPSTHMYGVCGA